jgi:hypothetical protein
MLECAALLVACGDSKPQATGASTSQSYAQPSQSASPLSLDTGTAPWPDADRVPDRITAAGLIGGDTEVLTIHYHAHLDIFVNGVSEPVAASIGRIQHTFYSPLHTHATSGMIHIETARDDTITLGRLFTEWGVRLTDACIGGYCGPQVAISAYVNGKLDAEPLPAIVFHAGDEIALVIGSPPASIPSNWDCNANIDPTQEAPFQCADFG